MLHIFHIIQNMIKNTLFYIQMKLPKTSEQMVEAKFKRSCLWVQRFYSSHCDVLPQWPLSRSILVFYQYNRKIPEDCQVLIWIPAARTKPPCPSVFPLTLASLLCRNCNMFNIFYAQDFTVFLSRWSILPIHSIGT